MKVLIVSLLLAATVESSLAFASIRWTTPRKVFVFKSSSNGNEEKHQEKPRFLFPYNPLNPKEADEPYQDEFLALKEAGAKCSLFDFDEFEFEFRPKPKIESDETIVYRGWMLTPRKYATLVRKIEAKGGKPFTSVKDYTQCHHLSGWYELCQDYTPETVCFPYDDNLRDNIASLDWDCYFIKDYVKSNTANGRGSIANSVEEAMEIVQLIATYRGEIEGGVAVRRVEEFVPNTEQRYFVKDQKAYTPTEEDKVPDLVQAVAEILKAPFYSVDTVMRQDGIMRLIEIGDGQVSDKKNWPLDRFVSMLME